MRCKFDGQKNWMWPGSREQEQVDGASTQHSPVKNYVTCPKLALFTANLVVNGSVSKPLCCVFNCGAFVSLYLEWSDGLPL